MNAARELYSDLLCHMTDDGGIRLNRTETLDAMKRLSEIGDTLERLKCIVSVPLVQLSNKKLGDLEIEELRAAEGT